MLRQGQNLGRIMFGLGALTLAACADSGNDNPAVGTQPTAPTGALPAPAAPAAAPGSTAGGMAPAAPAANPAAMTPTQAPSNPAPGSTPAPAAPAANPGGPATMGPPVDAPFNTAGYKDPGKGMWQQGTPDECKMDTTLFNDANVDTYAVYRYGKLCYMKGANAAAQMFSATKTLGGVMSGRAAFLTKDIARTGPGTGTIKFEDLGSDWIANPTYSQTQATISHVMGMVSDASPSLEDAQLVWSYDTVGGDAINGMIAASTKAVSQIDGMPTQAAQFVQQQVFDVLGMPASTWGGNGIGTGWSADLYDMGKLATLLLHDGFYGGEQVIGRDWVYRMSHPNFETATTSYGGLAWLNHRGNAEGIGGNIATGANAVEGDPCAPAAFWPSYPHFLSKATSCLNLNGGPEVCKQTFDAGVFSAQGLNGQFLIMHPGLDLAIVAQNFSGGDGPLGLWAAVRPGLVAKDAMFKGDEAAFCAAYGSGNYAPDLVNARRPPIE